MDVGPLFPLAMIRRSLLVLLFGLLAVKSSAASVSGQIYWTFGGNAWVAVVAQNIQVNGNLASVDLALTSNLTSGWIDVALFKDEACLLQIAGNQIQVTSAGSNVKAASWSIIEHGYKVWIKQINNTAGNATYSGVIAVNADPAAQAEKYKARIKLQNTSPYTYVYRISHEGVHLHTVNLFGVSPENPNGETFEQVFEVPSEEPLTVDYAVLGAETDGLIWYRVDDASEPQWHDYIEVIPVLTPGAEEPGATDPLPPPADGPAAGPPQGSSGVWGSSGASGTDPLTGQTYAEGVDKLAGKLDSVVKAVSAIGPGGGGTGTDVTGIEDRLDESNEHLSAISASSQAQVDAKAAADAADWQSARAQAEGEAKSEMASAGGQSGLLPAMADSPSAVPPFFAIQIPGYGTINVDPGAHPQAGTLLAWLKTVVAWFVVGLFQWFLWREMQRVYFACSGATQAKGNPVIAGTGAQATGLIAATIITGILLSVPGFFWAAADSGFTFMSLAGSNPFAGVSGPASAAYYLLTLIVPMGTLLACISQAFVARKGGLVIVAGVHAAVRFVVP